MIRLALIGTTVFAEQIKLAAEKTGKYKIVCYYNDLVEYGVIIDNDGNICRGPVIKSIEDYSQDIFDEIFICVGYTRFDLRERFYDLLKGKVPLATIIMPSVKLGVNVSIGEGVLIDDESWIGDNTIIQDNVAILKFNYIAHDNLIKKHTYISGRDQTAGKVTIGERCFLGISCLISDHINICDDVWLGLGSIVIRNLKKPGKYVSSAIKLEYLG